MTRFVMPLLPCGEQKEETTLQRGLKGDYINMTEGEVKELLLKSLVDGLSLRAGMIPQKVALEQCEDLTFTVSVRFVWKSATSNYIVHIIQLVPEFALCWDCAVKLSKFINGNEKYKTVHFCVRADGTDCGICGKEDWIPF